MTGIETTKTADVLFDAAGLRDAGSMTAGAGIELLDFGDRYALFHEGRQDLVELNATACHIWCGLMQGQDLSAIAASLAQKGVSVAVASDYVDDAVRLWLGGGWIVPLEVTALQGGAPVVSLGLSILGIGFVVEGFGAPPPSGLLDILKPLRGSGAAQHRVNIAAWRDGWLLLVDGVSRGLYAPHELVPAVKAALTDRVAASVDDGFIAHGGLVARSSRRMFLSGEPGAGKSTLALALAHAGFDCLSDDIVHVDARGWMKGAPFAPTLKAGSWPLLEGRVAGLESLPTHRRADGKDVRYAPGVLSAADAAPLDIFIALDRRSDGPAELDPISGLEAMRTLLEGAFASAGRISADRVKALATAFGATDCYVLRYAGLQDATDRLSSLANA